MRETPPRVEKPWGYEDHLEKNQDFVVKRILLRAGNRSSLQLHNRKREWVEVVEGTIELTMGTDPDALEQMILTAGDVYRVPPKTIHRVLAVEDALILEVCTPGDDDIVRLEDDYGRRGQHETKATRRDKLRALWDGPRAHLAAIVLVVGLILAGALVLLAQAVSLPALHALQADGADLYDVGGMYVEGWDSGRYDPFGTGAIRLLTVVLSGVYVASVMSLGSLVIRALRGSEAWPRLARVLASFLPGFLMVLAPLQLVFAALPLVAAAWTSLVLVTAVAVWVHRGTLATLSARVRDDAAYRTGLLKLGGWVLGLIALSALWRLQAGRNFMVSDSVISLLHAAGPQLDGVDHLLQWDQQSDEWLFSAPLMFTSRTGLDFAFPLWLAQSMGLVSFAALVFGVVHTLAIARPKLTAGLATGAVLAASPVVVPIYYISLVGGQNPAIFVGHPGRYIGILAPWVALLLRGRLQDRRSLVAAGFLTTGLAFLSIHVAVYVVVALVLAWLWTRVPRRPGFSLSRPSPRIAVHALAALALLTPLLTFGLLRRIDDPSPLGVVLLLGAVLGMGGAALVAFGSAAEPRGPSRVKLAAAWVGLLVLGFLLSNNLVSDLGVRDVLGVILPGYDAPLASRGLLGDSPIDGLTFPQFAGGECYLSAHCVSVGGYVAAYGFLTVLAIAAWVAFGRPAADDVDGNRRRAAWLAMVAALCVAFILVDFTGADTGVAWILTRFIEVPYYGLLALATITLVGARDRLTAVVGALVIGAWTVIPLVYNLVPLQLVKNLDWFVEIVSR